MVSGPQGDFPSLQYLGLPTVDLFATWLNSKVEAFYPRHPDPLTLLVNSMRADGPKGLLYPPASPSPRSLALHRVIH